MKSKKIKFNCLGCCHKLIVSVEQDETLFLIKDLTENKSCNIILTREYSIALIKYLRREYNV
jgi:hypothetical protein